MIDRAKRVLAQLEAADRATPARRLIDDLPLFSAAARVAPPPPANPAAEAVVKALGELNPDDLSPREALEALYRLRGWGGEAAQDSQAVSEIPMRTKCPRRIEGNLIVFALPHW